MTQVDDFDERWVRAAERAYTERDALRSAGHRADVRVNAQGYEVRIIRKTWGGRYEVSYSIHTPTTR